MHPAFWPYLIGLVPILLARTWRARIVAATFGVLSIGCGVYYVWILKHSPDVTTTPQSIRAPVISALVIALVSAVVTYVADKGRDKNACPGGGPQPVTSGGACESVTTCRTWERSGG